MTLLGLQFGLCFLIIKGTWIAIAIRVKLSCCEVKWWRHMNICIHERCGWRGRLWCFSVRLLVYYAQNEYNSWTKQNQHHFLTKHNTDALIKLLITTKNKQWWLALVLLSVKEVVIASNQVTGTDLARGTQLYTVDCKMGGTVKASAMPRSCVKSWVQAPQAPLPLKKVFEPLL